MDHVHDAPENRLAAARLLQSILDEARELAALRIATSSVARTPPSWLEPGAVTGVHVYPEGDGWRCDLTMDDVPDGRPNCIGAPDPFPGPEAARAFALSLLADVIQGVARRARMPAAPWPVPRDPVPFRYHGVDVPMTLGLLRTLRLCGGEDVRRGYVIGRLEDARRTVFGGTAIDANALDALPPLTRKAFKNLCGLAILAGIGGWPRPDSVLVAAE